MSASKRTFLVVGLGPTGGIFASHLARAGFEVWGIDIWREHVHAIRQTGMSIEGTRRFQAALPHVAEDYRQLAGKHFDFVGIAVKTPYLEEVLQNISCLDGNYCVVILQNGIDNEEEVARRVARERVLRLVVNYAGNVVKPGVIKMTFFNAPNYLGCLCGKANCPEATELADMLTQAGLDTQATQDIKRYEWQKTILNAALSPISALLNLTMEEVLKSGETRRVVEEALRECITVAKKAGFDYGDGFFDFSMQYLSKGGHHKPSMLIDLLSNRPTEIDFINGKFVEYGAKLGVATPVNETLTALVKTRERLLRRSA
jgi:2-dehydropantoate 2-reductase